MISPLAIEGHTDKDGEIKPAPVTFKIKGEERGKDEGTALAATTMTPALLACHAGGACCKYGLQSSCKTTRCACHQAGRNCVSCRCLMRCANVAPQTRQEEQRTTQRGPGDEEGRQKGEEATGPVRGSGRQGVSRGVGEG